MKHTFFIIFSFFLANYMFAQPWSFVKEKDGIKVYTRVEPNTSLKSFKGEVTLHAPLERVCSMLGNPNNTDWWDKEIIDIKVLGYDKNIYVQYYLVYKMPWPLTNRDIVAETTITIDPISRVQSFSAKPIENKIPEKQDLVRIKKYQQTWLVQPLEKGFVHISLQGSIDPGGNIPSWFYNMVIAETPMRTIHALRERVLSNKPANN